MSRESDSKIVKEEHWFRDHEKKQLDEYKKKREARIAEIHRKADAGRREELKKQHWMCCPKDGHPMREVDMKGVKIDMCTLCEGLFFDAGEIEILSAKTGEEKRSIFRKFLGLGD